jgi:hypothetical protein
MVRSLISVTSIRITVRAKQLQFLVGLRTFVTLGPFGYSLSSFWLFLKVCFISFPNFADFTILFYNLLSRWEISFSPILGSGFRRENIFRGSKRPSFFAFRSTKPQYLCQINFEFTYLVEFRELEFLIIRTFLLFCQIDLIFLHKLWNYLFNVTFRLQIFDIYVILLQKSNHALRSVVRKLR